MKRLRFTTLHLVLIGLILFAILAIFMRIFQSELAILIASFVIMAVVVGLLYYQKQTYELFDTEKIR